MLKLLMCQGHESGARQVPIHVDIFSTVNCQLRQGAFLAPAGEAGGPPRPGRGGRRPRRARGEKSL